MSAAPLEGLRVVELARVLAGPWIGQTLADLGAEVIKIESPEGDETRTWGPPYLAIDDQEISAYFASCNRGKRSVIANLSNPDDLERVKSLIAEADIFIENFKVGGLKKFGLDYRALAQEYPRLIYCSVTGFGQDGPYAHRAGYDFLIQAMRGIMDLTGEPEGAPQKIGVAFSDIFTGLYGVIAIQAALLERAQSGLGQHIDMALLDSMVGVLANQGLNHLATGVSPKRMGNAHPNICPYAVFPASDGHLVIAVGNDRQFARLCAVLDLEQVAWDQKFVHNSARVENREELTEILTERTLTFCRDDLLMLLEQHVVPASPINSVAEAFSDPQVQHRGMMVAPDGVPGIRTPIRFSRSALKMDRPPPLLGENRWKAE